MATAKKAAPKAATTSKAKASAKAVKPVAKSAPKKAPVSKVAKVIAKLSANIAKLTERKDKINTEINGLRGQRAALKASSAPAGVAVPAASKAKLVPKAATKK